MKRIIQVAGIGFSIFMCRLAMGATTFYVAPQPAGSDANQGTESQPFATIQKGIDAANHGDVVIVGLGTYAEPIHFNGKNITLRSVNPIDANVVANTIIQADNTNSVVAFAGTENDSCVLAGFTIRHADPNCSQTAGGICGGTEDLHAGATIRNNVITRNKREYGGAVIYCDGLIQNNTITNNQAWCGGGLAFCNGTIQDNTISHNHATLGGGLLNCEGTIENNVIAENMGHGGGGGLLGCSGLIQNNTIRGNWTEQDESAGGGLQSCNALIRNNIITGNRSRCDGGGGLANCNGTIENNVITGNSTDGTGGGLHDCDGLIQNNTVADNQAWDWSCGGLSYCDGMIRNCIIWGNAPVYRPQLYECAAPVYSCIERWADGGAGNITVNPHFVDPAAGDYHLQSWSPCVDAGDPDSDYSQEPQPNGSRVNMGAYGNTAEAAIRSPDTDADGLPDDWEYMWFGHLADSGDDDPDDDSIVNATEYRFDWNPLTYAETRVQNLTQNQWHQTIQDAIGESAAGDEIVAHPAVYLENISFDGRNVMLRSTEPFSTAVVAQTVIDGQQIGPAVSFSGAESETCVLSGFTLRNGKFGVRGDGTKAIIQFNRITGNSGSGLIGCDGLMRNNTIWANSSGYGGGLLYCHGVIVNCTVFGNFASCGGGLHDCDGIIRNCIIWGNYAERDPQVFNSSQPTYSCIQDWTGGGEGNLAINPQFVAPDNGDFHLGPWSPCIDAGDPATDFSNEPAPNGGRINMGAYGNTPEASSKSADSDSDGLPDDWEQHWFGDLRYDGASDPDDDGILNAFEYRYNWSPTAASITLVKNRTKSTCYATIQAALGEAAEGDLLVVNPGIYYENVRFLGTNVVLTSTYEDDIDAVSQTVIDGRGLGPVVTFTGRENESCVLAGFTIQNGKANEAGGILGECTHATIQNNLICRNIAAMWGGGLTECDGLIQNTVITRNTAGNGGGLFRCDGLIQNCTIAGNSAEWHGAMYQCHATILNSIVWGNISAQNPSAIWPATATYCCIEGWTDGGAGNIANNPKFANADLYDFRLCAGSPCIDAGNNSAQNLSATDIAGNHRILFGGKNLTVDIGAFEFCINKCAFGPEPARMTVTWSSLANKTYSIFWSSDMFDWQLADDNVPSLGNTTTSWTDDGSRTGVPPRDVPSRFYRFIENP